MRNPHTRECQPALLGHSSDNFPLLSQSGFSHLFSVLFFALLFVLVSHLLLIFYDTVNISHFANGLARVGQGWPGLLAVVGAIHYDQPSV